MIQQLVLASSNKGKIAEIQAMLKHQNIEIVSQSHFDVPDAEETGTTFIENAIIKARQATKISGLPAIADDSGLEVDALNGAPGVYSARYAGLPSNDKKNTAKLLNALADVAQEKRTARFHCVMVFMAHANDPSPLISHGVWEGRIAFQENGDNGFGYDPVFFTPEHQCLSAELAPSIKNTISHRAKALNQLMPQISDYFTTQA
ncbi:MAG: XTP/dITP diphosphohydrolase [Cycloclasticus pugetii]|jgi:XTP/dITP diphosphohydrolase|uniref:dITP/XTP pyrophosphatase n=2 Tax=Cycloclasticus TaxID=34067 RepID=S5TVA6_9GAMM|nr:MULTISPECIES: XTP/dITP diphosphatase [Cycloclasticus]AFT67871.1 Nucleoside 5-triphosphatase RdgB [Cycloclasticus sp. P1]AGS38958.1 Nucleoside 5-triphosphatase [Cycloclasticus zancles 78-ME]ATI02587.1 XTP/dITP diphosphatase [Cycloclasticus sp. PY97N]EPD12763.1 dITP/XTP pyrophosphatase [Cycloclasticus pugetii]MBV1899127.1 XTP/dITP diphosphatase [Cycloclasticus sp.]